MELTPTSERRGPVAFREGNVIGKFTALKEWLNRNPMSPTPQTPASLKNPDSPEAPKSATVSTHVAVETSVALVTEHQSSAQTKGSTDASVRITGISETTHQDQEAAFSSFEGGVKIEKHDPIPEPEIQAGEPMNTPDTPDMPVDLSPKTVGFADFEEQSQRSRASWDISESLSDGGDEVEPRRYTVSDGVNMSRTMLWLLSTAEPPVLVQPLASLGGIHHYKRDIDTETGHFLPEITGPDTLKTLHEGPSRDHRDIAWRQANMTAELQINREIRSRELLAMKLKAQIKPQPEPAVIHREAAPHAECVVRPATPQDFAAIAAIINMESRTKGIPQVIEWKEVTAADIQKIYDSCRENLQPFVVATTADDALLDRSNWPDNATKAYKSYLAFRSTQAKVAQEVLGFAYVMEARLGMFGGPCPGSRHTGQVKVIVHPDHRGKLYGSALLDRILVCTAPFHRRVLVYDWKCQNPSEVYEENPFFNRRKYAWIYIETFCDGRDGPALKQATKFLEKFEFQEMCYLRCAVKTDRYYESQWLDQVLWAREAQPRSNIADLMPGAENM